MLEPGQEYFLHYDIWPDPMAPVFKHSKTTLYQDVLIAKHEEHSSKDCTPTEEEGYTGRIQIYLLKTLQCLISFIALAKYT